jgi:hypothetical protein
MLRRASIVVLLLASALFANSALGASQDLKPKRQFVPAAPAPVDGAVPPDGLRGRLNAPAPASSQPSIAAFRRTPPLIVASQPIAPSADLSARPPASPTRVTPLGPVGDPSPICRAECAKSRITCASTDSETCDSGWAQCVADCSAPTLR